MFEALTSQLKDSVAGIILLGAVGSVLAVGILRVAPLLINKVLPAPYRLHRAKRLRQAYFQGWAAAVIHKDSSGKRLIAFLAFHLTCFVLAMFLFLFCVVVFTGILALQSQIALTLGTFASVTCAFLALYWAY